MMTRRRFWWAAGAGFALLAVTATLPMRWVLDGAGAAEAGLSARAVSGTIWSGTLYDARIGALPLGRLDAQLSPLALLGGRTELMFARADSALGALSGRLHGSGASGISDVNGDVALSARIGGLALGRLQLTGVTLRFDDTARCVEAGGTVQLGLSAPVAGLALAQGLSGALSCADGRAQALLASQSGMEKMRLSFDPKRGWTARFLVAQASDPLMVSALTAMGFQSAADGYVMTVSGRF